MNLEKMIVRMMKNKRIEGIRMVIKGFVVIEKKIYVKIVKV